MVPTSQNLREIARLRKELAKQMANSGSEKPKGPPNQIFRDYTILPPRER
jgi:hypothetical protein